MMSFKKYIEWLVYIIVFSLAAIFQTSFVWSLPGVYSAINLPLILILFSFLISQRNTIFLLTLILGFWLDILSFNFFGLHIIVLLSTVFVSDLIIKNWLTNRSLYSFLMLSLIGTIFYNIILNLFALIVQGNQLGADVFIVSYYFWEQLFWQIIWSIIFMILLFNLANSLSRNLKPFFLEKK
jgi:cell shape-determining protein MreD